MYPFIYLFCQIVYVFPQNPPILKSFCLASYLVSNPKDPFSTIFFIFFFIFFLWILVFLKNIKKNQKREKIQVGKKQFCYSISTKFWLFQRYYMIFNCYIVMLQYCYDVSIEFSYCIFHLYLPVVNLSILGKMMGIFYKKHLF